MYIKTIVISATVGCILVMWKGGLRAAKVRTNNQRGRGSGSCLLWTRPYIPNVLLVRVQSFKKSLYKAVRGPSTRPIVRSMTTGVLVFGRRQRRLA